MLLRNRMLMGGYRKPALMTTGAGPGTITPNVAGYALSGFADTCFAWLDAPKSQGKWYWEVIKQGANGLFGISDDVATSVVCGAYPSANAGIYTTTPNLWADGGWPGASWGAGWGGGTVANGDVLGFALDVSGKSLSIYQNNTLAAVLTWTSGPTVLWPMIAFQFGPSAQVNLGPSGCAYAPPAGYSHL